MSDRYDEVYGIKAPSAYEGASTSYKLEQRGLISTGLDADRTLVAEMYNLRLRTLHALRNNPYGISGLNKYLTNMGVVKVIWKNKRGVAHKRMQRHWDEFIENCNYDGIGNFGTFQAVSNSELFLFGNSYTRPRIIRQGNKNKVPMKLELIPSRLHYLNYISNDKNIKFGMKFDKNIPVNYYFTNNAWDEYWSKEEVDVSNIITFERKEIIHRFDRNHAGQWIGVPKLAPALVALYELDELLDATVAKQKASQAITWIVENGSNVLSPIGQVVGTKDLDGADKISFRTTGGNVQYLKKGEKITSLQSSDIGNNFMSLVIAELRRICAAIDIPYHSLTGDTSDLDYSSLRSIAIEFRTRYEYLQQNFNIPGVIMPVARTFYEYAKLYDGKVADAVATVRLPRRYGVDGLKDAQEDVLELTHGLAVYEDKLTERDIDVEAALESRRQLLASGLGFDSLFSSKPNNQSNNVKADAQSTSL